MPIICRLLNGENPVGRPDTFTVTDPAASGFATIWNTVLDALAPLGYEDQDGFHYGHPALLHGAFGAE